MPYKDVAAWSAMILGLVTNGKNKTAIDLFEEMEQKGPVPNGITFVAVLVACNHKTLLKKPCVTTRTLDLLCVTLCAYVN
ncbi:putative tetratricopeptide-like helical domain superfamily [Helianthus debilis subsp. tardiflorus]